MQFAKLILPGRMASLSVAALLIALALEQAWLSASVRASEPVRQAVYERSVRRSIGDLPLVVLRGNAEERARAFGVLCGRDFARMLSAAFVPAFTREKPTGWDDLVANCEKLFVFPAEFRKQAEAFIEGTRQLPEPERSIASLGRSVRVGDLIAMHAFPDLANSGQGPRGGCSSFSAWGPMTEDGSVITGRNLDYFTFPGPIPIMVVAQEPSEPGRQRTIEISVPGILGASTAMNEEGVFVMLHDEPGLAPAQRGGWIPRVLPLRRAIESAQAETAVEDFARVLRGVPLAMGGNVHLSFPRKNGQDRPAVFEWDGNAANEGVTIRRPGAEQQNAIFCTNHYLERRTTAPEGSTGERFEALVRGTSQAAATSQKIDVALAKKLLDAAAVRGQGCTYLSVIALPDRREMWAAVAPRPGASATDGTWTQVRWEDVFGK